MRWRALLLREETMLHPTAELLRRAAELHGIRRVRALHHHALEEIAAEHSVNITKPLVESERVSVRINTPRWAGTSTTAPHGTGRAVSPPKTASHGSSDSSNARLST